MPKHVSSLFKAMAFFLCVFAWNANAENNGKSILVGSEAWEGATEKDGSSLYWDILRLVYEQEGMVIVPSTSPYKRSVGLLKDSHIDIMVGAYENEIEGVLYSASHFDVDRLSALGLKKNLADWQGQKSLNGKHIASIRGYEIDKYLASDYFRHEYYDRAQIMQLIAEEKMDFFVDAEADLIAELKQKSDSNKHYDIKLVKELPLYFAFSNTERGRKLKSLFDKNFTSLVESGKLQAAFDKWQWTNYPF